MKEKSEKIGTQVGPCGIVCVSCPLGSGTIAETADRTKEYIKDCKIPEWAPMVSEDGGNNDWAQVDKGLEWMTKYAICAGCERGGGPPDCTIRICAKEKGHELCSTCGELDSCTKFEWLKENGDKLKETLKKSRGMSKKEYIKSVEGSMPWET